MCAIIVSKNNDLGELHTEKREFEWRRIDTLSFDPYDMLLPMILPYDTYRLFLVFSDRI